MAAAGIGGALEPGERAEGLRLRDRVGWIGGERYRGRQLLLRFLRMTLAGEQQPVGKARFEAFRVGVDRFLVVGNRGVGVVLGVLEIAEIEECPSIVRVSGEPGKQEASGLGVVLKRDIAFGVGEGSCVGVLGGLAELPLQRSLARRFRAAAALVVLRQGNC